jgi:cytochrome c oxidase subunit III
MSLLSRLAEKSWLTPGAERFDEPADYRPAALTVGLYVYFAVMAVIFSLTVAAYLMRMGLHEALGHGAGDWRPMPEPALLWVNSFILVLSGIAWEVARRAATDRHPGESRNDDKWLRIGTIAGGLLGIAFLFGQVMLWRHYDTAGYYLSANPANAFFYLLTAIHGLHLIGGLAAWLRVLGRPRLSSIRLCALYWHSLLLIWVLLAGLLLST